MVYRADLKTIDKGALGNLSPGTRSNTATLSSGPATDLEVKGMSGREGRLKKMPKGMEEWLAACGKGLSKTGKDQQGPRSGPTVKEEGVKEGIE